MIVISRSSELAAVALNAITSPFKSPAPKLHLYQPEDTPIPRWSLPEQAYLPNTQRPPVEALRLLFPGKAYDVSLFFQPTGQAPWFYDALFEGEGLTQGWRERRKTNGTDQYAAGKVWEPGAFRGWYVNIDLPFRRMPYGFDIVDQT